MPMNSSVRTRCKLSVISLSLCLIMEQTEKQFSRTSDVRFEEVYSTPVKLKGSTDQPHQFTGFCKLGNWVFRNVLAAVVFKNQISNLVKDRNHMNSNFKPPINKLHL